MSQLGEFCLRQMGVQRWHLRSNLQFASETALREKPATPSPAPSGATPAPQDIKAQATRPQAVKAPATQADPTYLLFRLHSKSAILLVAKIPQDTAKDRGRIPPQALQLLSAIQIAGDHLCGTLQGSGNATPYQQKLPGKDKKTLQELLGKAIALTQARYVIALGELPFTITQAGAPAGAPAGKKTDTQGDIQVITGPDLQQLSNNGAEAKSVLWKNMRDGIAVGG